MNASELVGFYRDHHRHGGRMLAFPNHDQSSEGDFSSALSEASSGSVGIPQASAVASRGIPASVLLRQQAGYATHANMTPCCLFFPVFLLFIFFFYLLCLAFFEIEFLCVALAILEHYL